MQDLSVIEAIKLFAPLIALQFGLAIFCAVQIFKKGVRNLNKIGWLIIVIFINFIGPVAYLLFGRKRGY